MIYPKVFLVLKQDQKTHKLVFKWISTRSGIRYSTISFWKWLKYPFSRVAWNSRALYKCEFACRKSKEFQEEQERTRRIWENDRTRIY